MFYKRAFLFIFSFCVALVLFQTFAAQAQISKNNRVIISPSDRIVDIGAQVKLYQSTNPDKPLRYDDIVRHEQSNSHGTIHGEDIIALGMNGEPIWMSLSITNNSFHEDWMLDFGKATQGRHMLAHKAIVKDHTHNKTHLLALRQLTRTDGFGEPFIGEALPISLPPQSTSQFIIYLEAEGGLAHTIYPRLIEKNIFLRMLRSGDVYTIIIRSFFITLLIAFLAIGYIKSDRRYGLYTLYYFANALLFILISENFFAKLPFMGEAIAATLSVTSLLGVLLTRFFLEIKKEDGRAQKAIFGLIGFTLLCSIINGIYYNPQSTFSLMLLYVPVFMTAAILSVLSFILAEKGRFAGHYISGAWLIHFVGIMITMFAAFGIITPNIVTLNAYFISLLPQALLFITAIMKRSDMITLLKRRREKRESQHAEQQAEQRHMKETEEQARLLRVIERERELMAELRERETQRAEEMRLAKETADEANRAKGAFLAVVSHEIRTPMNGILGMVRFLLDTKLSKQQNEYTTAIKESGDTMMALLNDILDFEKIESGNMDLEHIDFDLHKILNGIVMLMSGHASEKNISLSADIGPNVPQYLKGDPTRLRQVILNLVNNAIKFTDRGQVRILANIREDSSAKDGTFPVSIDIVDTGIGISKEGIEKLFKPFEQAESSTTRKYGGTGLGLAICQRLIEAMKSEIYVRSIEGKGSTFGFVIHFEQGKAELTETALSVTSKSKENFDPLHILIVEDNEMNRRVMNGLLEKIGHQCALAKDGQEGLDMLSQNNFDMIITDINMGGMNGLDMAKSVRALSDSDKASIPMIALTGNTQEDDIKMIYEVGLNDHLIKPVDPSKLSEMIEKLSKDRTKKPQHPKPLSDNPQAKQLTDPERIDKRVDNKSDAPIKNDGNNGLDTNMLQGLLDSLGKEAFDGLIAGYQETADNIIDDLTGMIDKPNLDDVRARAHELQGMAANFGITSLSSFAKQAEDAAKEGNLKAALKAVQALPDANKSARSALHTWIKDQ